MAKREFVIDPDSDDYEYQQGGGYYNEEAEDKISYDEYIKRFYLND